MFVIKTHMTFVLNNNFNEKVFPPSAQCIHSHNNYNSSSSRLHNSFLPNPPLRLGITPSQINNTPMRTIFMPTKKSSSKAPAPPKNSRLA
jgi:hypothetical protein